MGVDIIEQITFMPSSDFNDYTIIDELGSESEHLVWHQPGTQYATLTIPRNPAEFTLRYLDAFYQAMQDASIFDHPNIAPILDYGIHNNVPYVITPYYPGGTLLQYIRITGPLSLTETIDRLSPIAAALDYAHQHDIVHYALTPEVILRTADDECVLSGFSLGRLSLEIAPIPISFMPYAAPEVYLRMSCTAVVDIYTLGVIVYQMLTGELPFDGITYAQQMTGHVNHPVPAVRQIRPDLPPDVQHVIDRAMDKLPHVRYPTAGSLLQTLAQAAGLETDSGYDNKVPISRETIGGRYAYDNEGMKPGKLKNKSNGGYISLSKLFVDALMMEHHDPAQAAAIYNEIIQIEPQYSNGAIVERLARLEQELNTQQVPDLLAQANTALEAKDWKCAERLAGHLLSIDPLHRVAQRIQQMASSGAAAAEHYKMARLAIDSGERRAAIMLLREITEHTPVYDDPEGLRLINNEMAKYVRETRSLQAHNERILTLAFSPDNNHLVTGSTDKRVKIWQLPEMTLTKDMPPHPAWVCGTTFTPDGKHLLSATWDGEIRLWSMPDLAYAGIIAGLVNQVQAMAFAIHDPTLMATSSAQWLTLWQVPSGQRRATVYEEDRVPVTALAFSPAAPRLVCGLANGDIRIRAVEQPDTPLSLSRSIHQAPVYDVAVSPDGRLIASAARDSSIMLVDMDTGDIVAKLVGHTDSARSAAFSPDGSLLATCSRDRTIRLWNVPSGEPIKTLEGHRRGVRGVAFSPDGRTLASADSGGMLRLWRL